MIDRTEVAPLMLEACPTFVRIWEDESREFNIDEESGERLCYLDAIDITCHLVDLMAAGRTESFPAVFEVIERMHCQGDDWVRELATIGYLEGLQFVSSHRPQLDESDFVPYLGPESLRWWRGLVAYWDGRAASIEPIDA
jgi:hypothetical protein